MDKYFKKQITDKDFDRLLIAARTVRYNAYAPYSKYFVGAAILSESDTVYSGCNVESASYGITLCAERAAIGNMISAGDKHILAAVIVTAGPNIGRPCGMCLQMIAEFADNDLPIVLAIPETESRVMFLLDFLPKPFRLKV